MQLIKRFVLLLVISILSVGCFSDMDDDFEANIKDFVWKGMNYVYLYKDFKPDLADDRFSSDQDYSNYLETYASPEQLFEDLLYNTDRFSFLVNDYIALEQLLSGTTVSNGMEFALYYKPNSTTDVFGIVRYVLPNTSAASNGVQRGYVFDGLNGTPLTVNNYTNLYSLNSYAINLATYDNNGTPENPDDDAIIPGTESIELTKAANTENPVYISEVLNVGGTNVGYLMYNGFTADFNSELNNAFGTFLGNNVSELVLDLRYNSGGSVNSAILLSSMITGQFNGEIFLSRQWNSEWQEFLEFNDPESLINRFTNELGDGTNLNSLNLDRVFILTTEDSASASELVINSLAPYINVVQVGDFTTGKYQASTTLYDAPDFSRENANATHLYALQPLIFKTLNAEGFTDYDNGLEPDFELLEDFGNVGILGDENEPLLAAALDIIEGTGRVRPISIDSKPKKIGYSKDKLPTKNRMYIDFDLPIK